MEQLGCHGTNFYVISFHFSSFPCIFFFDVTFFAFFSFSLSVLPKLVRALSVLKSSIESVSWARWRSGQWQAPEWSERRAMKTRHAAYRNGVMSLTEGLSCMSLARQRMCVLWPATTAGVCFSLVKIRNDVRTCEPTLTITHHCLP